MILQRVLVGLDGSPAVSGSVARRVVALAEGPVLVVRPAAAAA